MKGSICAPTQNGFVPEIRRNAKIQNNVLLEDVVCGSPSSAGWVVIGKSNNGWVDWKDENGRQIAVYRE